MMEAVLTCSALTKAYGPNKALDNFTAVFSGGRITGLLGPNGSGKTTLMKLAAGLLVPTGGSLRVCGQAPGPQTKARVAYLPERTYLPAGLRVREGLAYMPYAPVLFISAQTGQRVDKLFSLIHEVYEQNHMRIPTGRLNAILAEATARVQPPTDKGRRLRIFYMTQASTCPPTFVCFCNDARLFHFSYQRYLENQIREVFGLTGTPVRMVIRERSDKSQ